MRRIGYFSREKSKGLMYRKDLSNSDGMLFIWKNAGKRCMWMKNTYISLDLGFFREDMTLIEVKELFPRSLVLYVHLNLPNML